VNTLLEIADRLRKVWWRVRGPVVVGVRGVVVDRDGRVLLVRHSYGADVWHIPGGGVKQRERLADAIRRELREEVGLDGGALQLLGTYSNMREGKSDHITVFVVTAWQRHTVDPAEIREQSFFSPDALPDSTSPGSRRRIAEWQAGAVTTFDW
jgi:ADP-ribose pyrophosphatase YjhB (NUDIX family)